MADGAVATGGAAVPSLCYGASCVQAAWPCRFRPEVPDVRAKLSDVHPKLPDVRSVSSDGAGQGYGGAGRGAENRFGRPVLTEKPSKGLAMRQKMGETGSNRVFFANFAEVRHRFGHQSKLMPLSSR